VTLSTLQMLTRGPVRDSRATLPFPPRDDSKTVIFTILHHMYARWLEFGGQRSKLGSLLLGTTGYADIVLMLPY